MFDADFFGFLDYDYFGGGEDAAPGDDTSAATSRPSRMTTGLGLGL